MKVGEIEKTHTFIFDDGEFSFHTAFQGGGSETTVRTFRSRMDTWPAVRAAAKGIKYRLLLGITAEEIAEWLEGHPQLPVRKVITHGLRN